MGNIRDLAKRKEARRLLAHLNKYQIERMKQVGGIYLDLVAVKKKADEDYKESKLLKQALRTVGAPVSEAHLYMAGKGKEEHVSKLRIEVAIELCNGQHGGLSSVGSISGGRLLYPFPNAPEMRNPMKRLQYIRDNTPDYITVDGECTFPGAPKGWDKDTDLEGRAEGDGSNYVPFS